LSDVATFPYSGRNFYGILMGIERKKWRKIATFGGEFSSSLAKRKGD